MKRILTGDRPTGPLHIGHYVGSLSNRVRLQQQYECFFIIADLHTLTTNPNPEEIKTIKNNACEMTLDYLSCGIDPARSTIFLQSAVPEIYELNLLFEMLVTVPRLQRLPSLKEMKDAANLKEMPFGLLGYPVLQAADILLPRAHLVPVGKDNIAHVELCREIARRFNRGYGDVFPLPDPMIGEVSTLIGTDGKAKMSKSLGNFILLSDDSATVDRRVMRMFTDPNRIHSNTPGRTQNNPVFIYHDIFNTDRDQVEMLKKRYRTGNVGDVEVKQALAATLNRFLDPIRERRAQYQKDTGYVEELIYSGTMKTREEGKKTLLLARKALGLSGIWNRISRKAEKWRKSRQPG